MKSHIVATPSIATTFSTILAIAALLALTVPALAEPAGEEQVAVVTSQQVERAESPWRLGVALGYGLRTNPLVNSDDIPIIVDLDISWFGEKFFFDNGDLGLTFADNPILTASVIARVNSDRVFFGKTNTKFISVGSLAGSPLATPEELALADTIVVPDRDYAGELGVEMLTDGRWGTLQLAAFHDVTGTHEGYELEADYSYGWRKQRYYVEPALGLSYKSEALNDYYWGTRPGETNAEAAGYEAGAGVNVFARLQFSYQLNRNWTFSFVGDVERLNDEAANSPIVDDQYIVGYFAGFGFRFR
jgi:outer membrane protein